MAGGTIPDGGGTDLLERPRAKRPRMHAVVMLNDDYTPAGFVVEVLQAVFRMSGPQATSLMLEVHSRGRGPCGVYTREVAETKAGEALGMARAEGHPLMFEVVPE